MKTEEFFRCEVEASTPQVEHEYFRDGAWTYLAAWDVHRAKVFGRCEVRNSIAPLDRLAGEVMSQAPYKTARSMFWIMDNCSVHRGQKAVSTPNGPTRFWSTRESCQLAQPD